MPKGALEDARAETRLGRIREQIRALEIGVADLASTDMMALLQQRSEVEGDLRDYEALGADVRAERTRLETVDSLLRSKMRQVVLRALRQGGLRAARQRLSPPRDHWWWYLDEVLAERYRRLSVRIGIALIGFVILILAGNYLANAIWGMDPAEREAYTQMTMADQLLFQGEYQQALDKYLLAVQSKPDLPEAWAAIAALYDRLGFFSEAQEAHSRVEALAGERLRSLLLLIPRYEQVGLLEKALTYAEEAVHLDPASAEAYLARGSVYASLGDRQKAIADLEKAADIALERGEDALYVLARTRMGMLLQQGQPPLPGPSGF